MFTLSTLNLSGSIVFIRLIFWSRITPRQKLPFSLSRISRIAPFDASVDKLHRLNACKRVIYATCDRRRCDKTNRKAIYTVDSRTWNVSAVHYGSRSCVLRAHVFTPPNDIRGGGGIWRADARFHPHTQTWLLTRATLCSARLRTTGSTIRNRFRDRSFVSRKVIGGFGMKVIFLHICLDFFVDLWNLCISFKGKRWRIDIKKPDKGNKLKVNWIQLKNCWLLFSTGSRIFMLLPSLWHLINFRILYHGTRFPRDQSVFVN